MRSSAAVSEVARVRGPWEPAPRARERLDLGRVWLPYPQSIQAIFFDVGYTLLDPYPSVPAIVQATLSRREIAVELARLEAALPTAEARFIQLTRENPLAWSDEQVIGSIWRQYFVEMLRSSTNLDEGDLLSSAEAVAATFDEATSYTPYADVQPVLLALHQRGLKLGVVSDWGVALSVILRHHELTRYFDFTVISATARRAKPDPALFQLALERADVIPDYTLHIGDSYIRDALGARAVGITPVLIDRERTLEETVPDCPLVYDLNELLDLLEIPRPNAWDASR
jgi:putative hydrolase of the HAD superfamily